MGSLMSNTRVQAASSKIRSVLFRAVRAIDEPDLSERFLQGHAAVLAHHKVGKVISANDSWLDNPNVYLITAQSPEGSKLYGGARIHLATENVDLPLQQPVRKHDQRIDDIIAEMRAEGCGELCALWNSVEVAGLGIGSKLVINCGVSLAEHLQIRHLLALSSPVTRRWMPDFGFFTIESIGDKGGIPYPNERLIATVAHYVHPDNEEKMNEALREEMLELRSNPGKVLSVSGPKGSVNVHFDLSVKK